MGIRASFPLAQSPVAFKKTFEYDASGLQTTRQKKEGRNDFEVATSRLFHHIEKDRIKLQEAKHKFREFKAEDMKRSFPNWKANQLIEFKSQFLMFDLNQDGLIDFEELNEVLIDLGDESSDEERRDYFNNYDEDGSGRIDFEEFLQLLYRVQFDDCDSLTSNIYKKSGEESRRIKRLSIVDQMHHGVF
ncbi:uncharacterized protein LOC135483010 [Lineus longissimus]|uniref:uncharacterized protein LOC135483010 n=1 Tax=Lineus longissimus TaxID=88925 RepID=UPI00315C9483